MIRTRQPRGSRMEQRAMRRRIRRRRAIGTTAAVIVLIGLVALVGLGVSKVWPFGKEAPDFEGPGHGLAVVRVESGDTTVRIGERLLEANIVKSARAFTSAAAGRPGIEGIQPGYYQLRVEMSGRAAVDRILMPGARVGMLDIKGGATLEDVVVVGGAPLPGIYRQISTASCVDAPEGRRCLSVEEIREAASHVAAAELGVPEWARERVEAAEDPSRRLEGLIAAGVHDFDPRLDAAGVLRSLVSTSAVRYENAGITAPHPLAPQMHSPYDFLIGASLLEREARQADFGKVARVILNRLQEGKKLEFDSTVNYALREQEVGTSDSARAAHTPWNTYAREGLPATPISAPSLAALRAMEEPADGDWLYFVTIDREGTTVFNRDFEAHQEATRLAHENGVFSSGG